MGKKRERRQSVRWFKQLANVKSRHEQPQRIRKLDPSISDKVRRERAFIYDYYSGIIQPIKTKFNSLHDRLQFLVKNSLVTQQKPRWGLIMDVINKNAKTADPKTLQNVCSLLLDALRNSPCSLREISIRIIITCFRYLIGNCPVWIFHDFETTGSYLNLWTPEEGFLCPAAAEVVLKLALPTNIAEQDSETTEFESMLKSVQYCRLGSVPVWPSPRRRLRDCASIALNASDWKLLSVLVQYGFWNEEMYSLQVCDYDARDFVEEEMPLVHYCTDCVSANKTDFIEFKQTCVYIGRDTGQSMEILERIEEIWQGLRNNNGGMSFHNNRGFRRIPLLIRMLRITTLDPQSRRTHEYLHCLRFYVSALPDPLVSVDEVREFLLHLFEEARDRHVVDTYVDRYTEIFGQRPYEPRSLVHLCCCAVRSTLLKNESPTLPILVKGLNIPDTSKKLLLGTPETSLWSWGKKEF